MHWFGEISCKIILIMTFYDVMSTIKSFKNWFTMKQLSIPYIYISIRIIRDNHMTVTYTGQSQTHDIH